MPRPITTDLLVAVAKVGQSKPRNNEPPKAYLARQTHFRLNGKRLTSGTMPAGACPLLKALYLFDNEIEVLEVGSLPQLTHLYAQNNRIEKFGGLADLSRLRKLYISGNQLSSLAPLAALPHLEELHAASQRVGADEPLDVAPTVLAAMRELRVLDLANNRLDETSGLAGCRSLTSVNLTKNRLDGLASVAPLLGAAPLVELDLRENAVSEVRQHLDAIVVACPTISRLNGRELIASERPYLESLHRLGKRRVELVEIAGAS